MTKVELPGSNSVDTRGPLEYCVRGVTDCLFTALNVGDSRMHEFHGDLLIGGFAIRSLHGELDEAPDDTSSEWSGHFEIEPSQKEVLEVGRQYLLMLDDGRNAEVVVTSVHNEPDQDALVCDFQPWHDEQLPPR